MPRIQTTQARDKKSCFVVPLMAFLENPIKLLPRVSPIFDVLAQFCIFSLAGSLGLVNLDYSVSGYDMNFSLHSRDSVVGCVFEVNVPIDNVQSKLTCFWCCWVIDYEGSLGLRLL
jgi:hypothetical protein